MYYRAFFGTITMLGLAALIGMFAVLSSSISPPSQAYAQSNNKPAFPSATATRSVAESLAAGSDVGAPITATDSDDAAVIYELTDTANGAFQIDWQTGQLKTRIPLDYETRATYTVVVLARDNKDRRGGYDTAVDDTITVTVDVINVDEAGEVSLSWGQPQIGTELEASLTDPDSGNTGLTWKWESIEGKAKTDDSPWTVINEATSATFTPNRAGDVRQYLRATASYTNREGERQTAVAVSAHPVREAPTNNTEPYFAGDTANRSVAENTAPGNNIGNPVSATDADTDDGDELSYTLGGANAASFTIDAATGQLGTKAALNYEIKSSYTVTVTAEDPSGATDTITVTINLADETTMTGPTKVDYPENGTHPVAIYQSEGGALSLTASPGDFTDSNFFSIDNNGELRFIEPPNHEFARDRNEDNVYDIMIMAGSGHNAEDFLRVKVTVTNAAEAPAVTGPSKVDYPENGAEAVHTYAVPGGAGSPALSLAGTDRGDFTLDGGELAFKTKPDYETPRDANRNNKYLVTIIPANGGLVDSLDITVTVTDVNEPLEITTEPDLTIDYVENDAATVATYTATDPDKGKITWAVSGEDSDDFSISRTGKLSFATPPDYENPSDADRNNVYLATVEASDGTNTDTRAVTVTVTNVEERPAFAATRATRNITENLAAGENIGAPVAASDGDGDPLTYSLSGRDVAAFNIVASSGQLQTKLALDREAKSSYAVTVSVHDGKAANGSANTAIDDTIRVTITVDNGNEPPTVTGPTAVNYPENGTGTVVSYRASDPEGDPVTWFLQEGTDRDDFSINAGKLTFKTPPNYEAPTDANRDNVYQVTVQASDGSLVGSLAVTVTVIRQNEAPMVTGDAAVSYPENGTGVVDTYSATDQDGGSVTWSLAGTDRGDFSISVTGALTFRNPPNFEAPADANRNNEYLVTVRANDGAATGATAVKVTVTDVNEPPAFPNETVTLTIAENTAAGRNIAGRIGAADPDRGSALTYNLDGRNAASFVIVPTSGQLQTKAGLNYETRDSYTVTVSVSDGKNSHGNADTRIDDTTTIIINVTNRNEPPGKPAAPTVAPASSGGHTALDVSWLAPANTGPDINGYYVEYREKGAASWRADNVAISGTRATINAVTPDTAYEARVRARNAEDTGLWSDPGQGITAETPANLQIQLAANYQSQAYAVREGSAIDVTVTLSAPADRALQIPITVTRGTAEIEDYQVSGLSDATLSFAPGDSSQRFSFQALQDFDQRTDTVDLGFGQLPDKVVAGGSDTAGVSINDDDRVILPTPTPAPTPIPTPAAAAGGDGGSNSDGSPVNQAPVFTEGISATRSVAEDTGWAIYIGKPVAATDADKDLLTYSLVGVDAASFAVDNTSGQLITEAPLDFETQAGYVLIVKVSDGRGASDVIFVTINVTDLPESPIDNPLTQAMGQAIPGMETTVKTWDGAAEPVVQPAAMVFPVAGSVTVATVPEQSWPTPPAVSLDQDASAMSEPAEPEASPAPQQVEPGDSPIWAIIMMILGATMLASGGGFYLIARRRQQRQWR